MTLARSTAAVLAAGLSLAVGAAGTAYASEKPQPKVTRAALDPALVAGRGATVAFQEQEAEKAAQAKA